MSVLSVVSRTLGRALLPLWGLLVVVWLVVPLMIVAVLSFTGASSFVFPPPSWSLQWYHNLVEDPAWARSSLASVQIALITTVVATVLGTAGAFGVSRATSRLAPATQALLLLPTIVPPLVAGIGMYSLFLQWRITGTIAGFVLAHTVLAVPYVVVSVTASLQSMDRRLELASAVCGAPPARTFLSVTLPSILPGVLTGALLAFLSSFNETLVSVFLGSPVLRTLPVQMYTSVSRESDPTIAAASTTTTAVSATLFAVIVVGLAIRARRVETAASRHRVDPSNDEEVPNHA